MEESTEKDTRVAVWAADGKTFLGMGTYLGEIPFSELLSEEPTEDAPKVVFEDENGQNIEEYLVENNVETPQIKLDNGKTMYGYECWWQSEADYRATYQNN